MEIKNLTAEKLLKYISLLSVIYLLGGISYNVLYYDCFNISIVNYIDLNESITLFTPFSPVIIILALLTALIFYSINYLHYRKNKIQDKKKLFSDLVSSIVSFTALYILVVLFHSSINVKYYEYFKFFLPLGCVFIIIQAIGQYLNNTPAKIPSYFTYALFCFILYAGYIVLNSSQRSEKIKKGTFEKEVSFTINDSTIIKTDTVVLYIGETKNYIFTYNRKTEITTVFPKSKMTKLEYKESNTTRK